MSYRLGIIEGDDIGPEVVPEAVRVAKAASKAAGVRVSWSNVPLGWSAYTNPKIGTTMPADTLDRLRRLDGWILGPIGHRAYPKDDPKAIRPIPIIRKALEMYSSVRPVKSYAGIKSLHQNVDMVIVRENTEGFPPDRNMFLGNGEFRPTEDLTLSIRVVTRKNSARIARVAFEIARTRPAKHVTAVHKETVFKLGCGMFAEECRKVASEFPDIRFDEVMVDTFAVKAVMEPQQFDTIVITNTFGDIMVDLCAGLVGGMGLAPAISASDTHVMAQASHGSAPDIAGKGIANPYAEIMSMALMFEHFGRTRRDRAMRRAARLIERATEKVIAAGTDLTPDLGGKASTTRMGRAIAAAVGS
jgi:3-isopropylmalate dehydrogenase